MNAIALDPNWAMVIMGVIGIIVPMATLLVNFIQNSRIASDQSARATSAAVEVAAVAVKVQDARNEQTTRATETAAEVAHVASSLDMDRKAWEQNQNRTDKKLDEIHVLVNSQLSEAVSRFKDALVVIDELKGILMRLAPNDPRVQELVSR